MYIDIPASIITHVDQHYFVCFKISFKLTARIYTNKIWVNSNVIQIHKSVAAPVGRGPKLTKKKNLTFVRQAKQTHYGA